MNPGDVSRINRIRSNALIAMADPGRYAPQTTRQLTGWLRAQGQRQHEMEMLEKNGAIAVDKANAEGKWKAEAARMNGEAAAMQNKEGTIAEAEAKKHAADVQADAAIKASQNQWGYVGPDGNWIEGGQTRSDRAKAEATLGAAKAQAEATEYGADRSVDAAKAKGESEAAALDRRMESERVRQENAKEIAQMQIMGRPMSEAETTAWYEYQLRTKNLPDDKKLDLRTWLRQLRGVSADK